VPRSHCDPSSIKNIPVCGVFTIAIAVAFALPATSSSATISRAGLAGISLDVIPGCHLPAGVVAHSDQKEMPAALRDAIKQKLGYLVSPTIPFDAADVVMTGHNRRLIFIWVRGSVWVVATEHGGRGYNDPILAYQLDPKGLNVKLVAERIAVPNTVCSTADELLNQRPVIAHAP
jgi:hypothetical protein